MLGLGILLFSFSFRDGHSRIVYRRSLFEDITLPFPNSVHELEQHRFRYDRQLGSAAGSEITPLYPGYGTHFSYIYVGTPPQRQSVIIDTGSHYTAFPCTGCSQCGQHTDSYWDLKNSSTASVPQCNQQPCAITQSYSEGSSWRAFKVVDKLWVGGITPALVPDAHNYAVDFQFGCQTSETGLFRTQLADGIMGMSIADDTLPDQLVKQGVTDSRLFALCFRVGGGIMTLGGVDQRIHLKPGISYAKLTKNTGWFTVNLVDILLQDQKTFAKQSLGGDASQYNSGKGCIVDSGTTDTYFPAALASKFNDLFKKISGVSYSSANTALSAAQLSKMPNLVFVLEDTNNSTFEVEMPWTSFVDSVGGGKYAFRVYLSEGSGTVLGANFMNGYNVMFDVDQNRVGFAKSNCKYEDFAVQQTLPPSAVPTHRPTFPGGANGDDTPSDGCVSELLPIDTCSASCDKSSGGYIAEGNQTWVDKCGLSIPGVGPRLCHIACNGPKIVRGDPSCPEKAWTECPKGCIQSRMVPKMKRHRRNLKNKSGTNSTTPAAAGKDKAANACTLTQQTRTCYTGACPVSDGDYLIFIDLRIRISPVSWSYVFAEAFYGAFSEMFNVRESSIELLNDASTEYTMGVKLHFQLRLKAKDFDSVMDLHDAAQAIPVAVWGPQFGANLIRALQNHAMNVDHIDYDRFGFLFPSDVDVLNAMAVPFGDVRDPVEIPEDANAPVIIQHIKGVVQNQLDLILLGVAIASLLIMTCVLCMYYRLRREHAALEKDKIMGGSLRRMWNRFMHLEKMKGSSFGRGDRGAYKRVAMNDLSEAAESGALTAAGDDELDEAEQDGN